MNTKFNILITGAGGDIGQSIGKILNQNPICNSLVGADIELESAAKFIFNKFYQLPKCDNSEYLDALKSLVNTFSIDVIIPASEQEIRFFSNNPNAEKLFGDKLILANLESRMIGLDKLETVEFLRKNGFGFPRTEILKELSKPEYPIILKSRFGSGSKSIFIVDNDEDLNFFKKKYPDFLAQEYISSINQEYTCGLFQSSDKEIRHIVMHRKMMDGGQTGFGEVVENSEIAELLEGIAVKLDLLGSINVQLRMTGARPVVFEINPRISSTVLFRHLLGFHDILWSIYEKFNLPITQYTPPPSHSKFYKGYTEYVTIN
jgi:carbamoyl-phosphate synthase large subunit